MTGSASSLKRFPMCSKCSRRRNPRSSARKADWASACRSPKRSSSFTAGRSFIVRLPLMEGVQAAEPVRETSVLPQADMHRILVVDDNRDNADSLAMMLRLMGTEVGAAYDGEQALELAATRQPQVILLDIGIPRLDGYEVCRRIRQQSWGKAIVIIALTGWGQQEDRARSLEAGFDHHLVKPVDAAELVEVLGQLHRAA